jgi:hypothetical protein
VQGELTRERAGAELTVWLEAIAKGLGCDTGSRTIELRFEAGRFRSGYLHHGPINENELNGMFQWPEPPAESKGAYPRGPGSPSISDS